jgi:Ca-activated chloride channel homolog
VVLLPFDLRQTNLPLLAAYPILMSNLLGYLEPPSQATQRDLRPGDSVTVSPLAQAEEILVRQPGGQSQTLVSEGRPIQFTSTLQPGLYMVLQRAAGQTLLEEPFSINASDERESDVRPKPVALGSGRTLEANAAPDLVPVNREIWMWLVPPVLALLLIEWYWFHRKS